MRRLFAVAAACLALLLVVRPSLAAPADPAECERAIRFYSHKLEIANELYVRHWTRNENQALIDRLLARLFEIQVEANAAIIEACGG